MIEPEEIEKCRVFEEYLEYYPEADEEGYDGVHFGGIKGLRPDAPESAKKAYAEWVALQKEYERRGIKV